MKIWMISDTHIGCHSNSLQWINLINDYFFNFFIPYAKKNVKDGDVLFHLGDVYDNRQSLNLLANDLGIKIFEELGSIFSEVHGIPGNHDLYKKYSLDITSIDNLKWIPNVTFHKNPCILKYGGTDFLLVPWRISNEEEVETISKFNAHFAFFHTEAKGVQMSNSKKHISESGTDIINFSKYNRVYSGHIHQRQEKSNLVFVGNPYEMTRSDSGNQKGFYILDTTTGKHSFIKNDYSPLYKSYYIEDVYDKEENELKDMFKNNFIDIKISSNISTNKYDLAAFIEKFQNICIAIKPIVYESDLELNEEIQSDEDYSNFNILNFSNDYINESTYDEKLKNKLNSSIKDLYLSCIKNEN